jgi:aminobenzoyl-glutamate transport protein
MPQPDASIPPVRPPLVQRFLDRLEQAGNKLPDPAMIFVLALALTLVASLLLAAVEFDEPDPRLDVRDDTGQLISSSPVKVKNMLSGENFTNFITKMVKTFTDFPPLGVVLVAMLGVAVAEHAGFIQVGIKYLLKLTPRRLLTPALVLVAILSHSAGDTGYVLVIPLGGVVFAAAGRHPVAGIRRVQRVVPAVGRGSLVARLHAVRRAHHGSDACGQSAVQLVFHERLVRPHHRGCVGVDRPLHRAALAASAR